MQSYPLMHFSQLLKHPAKKIINSQHSLTSAVLLRSHLPATDRPNPKYCNLALAFLLRRRMVLTMTPSKNELQWNLFWNRTLCFKGGWIGHFHLKVHAKQPDIKINNLTKKPRASALQSLATILINFGTKPSLGWCNFGLNEILKDIFFTPDDRAINTRAFSRCPNPAQRRQANILNPATGFQRPTSEESLNLHFTIPNV